MQSALFHAEQIPLEFPVRSSMGREDFMIGQSNQDALIWIDQWPSWPAPALFLSGPAASGKSHLAALWQEKTDAQPVKPEELAGTEAEELAKRSNHLLIDGIDTWLGDRDSETALFHLYNIMKEERRTLLLTGRATPTEIDFIIPDLASRLRAAPCTRIKSPNDTLLQNIIIKRFYDRQVQIGEAELNYLMPRIERSFKFIGDIVEKCDNLALSKKRAVTIPVIREALIQLG